MMKRVAVCPFPDFPNAYICVSGQRRPQERFGDKWYVDGDAHTEHEHTYSDVWVRTRPCITFTYDAGDVCAEWDGDCGPIQLWFKCEKGYKPDEYSEAREHWLYEYAHGQGCWSQKAVDDADLPRMFSFGNYDGIFRVLKEWAESRSRSNKEAA